MDILNKLMSESQSLVSKKNFGIGSESNSQSKIDGVMFSELIKEELGVNVLNPEGGLIEDNELLSQINDLLNGLDEELKEADLKKLISELSLVMSQGEGVINKISNNTEFQKEISENSFVDNSSCVTLEKDSAQIQGKSKNSIFVNENKKSFNDVFQENVEINLSVDEALKNNEKNSGEILDKNAINFDAEDVGLDKDKVVSDRSLFFSNNLIKNESDLNDMSLIDSLEDNLGDEEYFKLRDEVFKQIKSNFLNLGNYKKVSFQLNPQSLGSVSVNMKMQRNGMSIEFLVEKQEIVDMLNSGIKELQAIIGGDIYELKNIVIKKKDDKLINRHIGNKLVEKEKVIVDVDKVKEAYSITSTNYMLL